MPLYDVTGGKQNARYIDPNDVLCNSEHLAALERKLHSATYKRVMQTAREAIESIVANGCGKLVWTKAGAIFGYKSVQPHAHIDHMWDAVPKAVGDGRDCLIAIGTILRLVIAERPETWLLWVQESDDIDELTGKKIKVSQYWIDQSFFVTSESKKKGIEALKEKWGARA